MAEVRVTEDGKVIVRGADGEWTPAEAGRLAEQLLAATVEAEGKAPRHDESDFFVLYTRRSLIVH